MFTTIATDLMQQSTEGCKKASRPGEVEGPVEKGDNRIEAITNNKLVDIFYVIPIIYSVTFRVI